MFGIGFTELIIIVILALIVFGPERLPELARTVGLAIRDLRRMYNNLRADLGPEYEEIERGIQSLRSLDPRRDVRRYGRKFLDDIADDVGPEIKTLARTKPSQVVASWTQPVEPTPPATSNGSIPQVATEAAPPASVAIADEGAWEEASAAHDTSSGGVPTERELPERGVPDAPDRPTEEVQPNEQGLR